MTPERPSEAPCAGRKPARLGPRRAAQLAREMVVIPAQLWLALAETAGFAVLAVWKRAVLPATLAVLVAARAAYRAPRAGSSRFTA